MDDEPMLFADQLICMECDATLPFAANGDGKFEVGVCWPCARSMGERLQGEAYKKGYTEALAAYAKEHAEARALAEGLATQMEDKG